MPKFNVRVEALFHVWKVGFHEIEAKNKDEAIELAMGINELPEEMDETSYENEGIEYSVEDNEEILNASI